MIINPSICTRNRSVSMISITLSRSHSTKIPQNVSPSKNFPTGHVAGGTRGQLCTPTPAVSHAVPLTVCIKERPLSDKFTSITRIPDCQSHMSFKGRGGRYNKQVSCGDL